jgi:hypothetical protein
VKPWYTRITTAHVGQQVAGYAPTLF